MKVRNLSAVVAIGALAALPGCSTLGIGGGHEAQPMATAAPPPAPAPAPAPMPSDPQQNALSHSLVRHVQTELKQNHMYSGRVDGIWGPMTRRGVTSFQEKNGVQPTGQLDNATLQAMNLTAPGAENNGMNNGTSGSMDNGTSGSMNNGTSGSTDNGTSGSMNSGTSGSMNNGTSGSMSGGTSGSMNSGTSGGSMNGAPPSDTTGGTGPGTGGQAAPAR